MKLIPLKNKVTRCWFGCRERRVILHRYGEHVWEAVCRSVQDAADEQIDRIVWSPLYSTLEDGRPT